MRINNYNTLKVNDVSIDYAEAYEPLLNFIDRKELIQGGYRLYIRKKDHDLLLEEKKHVLSDANCEMKKICINSSRKNEKRNRYIIDCYEDDIDIFVNMLIEEGVMLLPKYRRIIMHGGRGGGKSEHCAIASLEASRVLTGRILCGREIQESIEDSIYYLIKSKAETYYPGEFHITASSIVNKNTGTDFLFKGLRYNIDSIKSIPGIILAWVEEAQSATVNTVRKLEKTIRADGSQIWYTFNREKEDDAVYTEHCLVENNRTLVLHINYDRNPFFPEEMEEERQDDLEKVAAGVMSQDEYNHEWEGEPLSQTDNAIFKRESVIAAMKRKADYTDSDDRQVGIDVAGLGKDLCCFTMRIGNCEVKKEAVPKLDHAGKILYTKKFVNYDTTIPIVIDGTNMTGFGQQLRDEGYNVYVIHFASAANDKTKYGIVKHEMVFELADLIDEGNISLIDDKLTKEELCTIRGSKEIRGNKHYYIVESKKEHKKRLKRSPDRMDSLMMAFYKIRKKKVSVTFL